MAGIVIGLGLMGGGLALQTAMTVRNEGPSTATAPTASAGLQSEQMVSHRTVVRAHAVQQAEGAIAAANTVMAAAEDKTNTTALSGFVAALTRFALLETGRIVELVEETEAETAIVKGATAEADRIAAEEVEAAEAAAAADAAAQAVAAAEAEAAAAAEAEAEADPTAPSHPPNQRGGRDRP